MAFTAHWGQPVRDAVQSMALSTTATARAIHESLCAGVAAPEVGPDDVPPQATVQRWVFEHRRAAREAVNGAPGVDVINGVANTLGEKLKRSARDAKTPNEIAAVAKAAQELARLDRALDREPKKPTTSATGDLPATPAPQAPDETDAERYVREMAENEARASRDASHPTREKGHGDWSRGPHDPSRYQNNRHNGAAAS